MRVDRCEGPGCEYVCDNFSHTQDHRRYMHENLPERTDPSDYPMNLETLDWGPTAEQCYKSSSASPPPPRSSPRISPANSNRPASRSASADGSLRYTRPTHTNHILRQVESIQRRLYHEVDSCMTEIRRLMIDLSNPPDRRASPPRSDHGRTGGSRPHSVDNARHQPRTTREDNRGHGARHPGPTQTVPGRDGSVDRLSDIRVGESADNAGRSRLSSRYERSGRHRRARSPDLVYDHEQRYHSPGLRNPRHSEYTYVGLLTLGLAEEEMPTFSAASGRTRLG